MSDETHANDRQPITLPLEKPKRRQWKRPAMLGGLAVAFVALVTGGILIAGPGEQDDESTTADAQPTATESSATATTSQEAAGVTWEYLLSEYSSLIYADCVAASESFPDCARQLVAQLGPFSVDVAELPVSRARANVLTGIDMLNEGYDEYSSTGCIVVPTDLDCTLTAFDITSGHNILSTNVKREAGAL